MNIAKTTFILLFQLQMIITASGFQINEHGSKAMSMGGAFAGLADDPSALYFNPSGLTQISGISLLAGGTFILPSSGFRGPLPQINEYKQKTNIFFPPHVYASYQYNDKLFFGFGIGNNFGLGTEWDKDWVGRYIAVETSLRTFFFTGAASYKITPYFSIGFGYSLVYGDVRIGRSVNLAPFNGDAYLEMEGNGIGSGFIAGLLLKPNKYLSIGLSYRSQVSIEFSGSSKPSNYPGILEWSLPDGDISAPLTTPENITIGLAVKPVKSIIITADYQFVGWNSYDKLEIEFEDFADQATGDNLVSISERNYSNGFIGRLGIEYIYSRKINLYGGLLYDSNPISDKYLDPTLPDADRIGLSCGFSYMLTRDLSIEAGYLFLRFDERKINNSLISYSGIEGSTAPFNGVYNSTAHLLSFSFAYNLN